MGNVKNLKRGNPATQFTSGQRAVECAKKAAIARKRNNAERKLIKERILERMKEDDWDELIDNLIMRAKESNKDFETLRDTIGEKPTETVSMQTNINNPLAGMTTEELRELIDDD